MDEISKLLDAAKQNLEDSDNEDTVDSIGESWRSLPQMDDDTGSRKSRLQNKNGVTTLMTARNEQQPRGIRKVVDPVQAKLDKKHEEESSAGSKWFNMPKTEVTPEIKRDLQVLQMRSALDPKRHYKKDKSGPPKYFQTGTIVEDSTEYFSARLSKKERQQTLADEILADSKSQQYFKRKYDEVQTKSKSGRKGHYKKVQKMRKKL